MHRRFTIVGLTLAVFGVGFLLSVSRGEDQFANTTFTSFDQILEWLEQQENAEKQPQPEQSEFIPSSDTVINPCDPYGDSTSSEEPSWEIPVDEEPILEIPSVDEDPIHGAPQLEFPGYWEDEYVAPDDESDGGSSDTYFWDGGYEEEVDEPEYSDTDDVEDYEDQPADECVPSWANLWCLFDWGGGDQGGQDEPSDKGDDGKDGKNEEKGDDHPAAGNASNCGDGVSNDGDDWVDSEDPECADTQKREGNGSCGNGSDDDDDTFTDGSDSDCGNESNNDDSPRGMHPSASESEETYFWIQ